MEENLAEKIKEKIKKDFIEFKTYLNKVSESFLSSDGEELIAMTPKETIFENDIMEIYRYKGDAVVPVLIVNPLINGYYILDLLPEISFTAYMVENQLAPYIINWKNIDEYRRELNFDYYLKNGLKVAIDFIYEREKKKLVLLGHCLGGILSSAYLSIPENNEKILKYISLNSPYDFSKMGEVGRLIKKDVMNVDKLVDTFGNLPAEYMNVSFQFINPGQRFKSLMNIFHFYANKTFMRLHKALLKWRDDNITMPGEFFRVLVKDFFQENRLFNEQMKIMGRIASLKHIRIPVLNIVSKDDDIVPIEACEAIQEKVEQIEKMELPDGHLAIILMPNMGVPHELFWGKIIKWVKD